MGFGDIIYIIVIGLVAGFIARAVVPGRQNMGIIATLILGIVGSLLGGVVASLIQGGNVQFHTAGLIASIIGAIVTLLIYGAVRGRSARA